VQDGKLCPRIVPLDMTARSIVYPPIVSNIPIVHRSVRSESTSSIVIFRSAPVNHNFVVFIGPTDPIVAFTTLSGR
jgi:hypothetical protein